MKKIVVYFSASGITKGVAAKMAGTLGADLFEIRPLNPYTPADLNWNDKNSRSSIEMRDKTSRPAITNKIINIDEYDTIYLGFPIWWGVAPTIVNTFLESYDLSGKKIIPFATSGGSPIGNTVAELKRSVSPNTIITEGTIISKYITEDEIKSWAYGIDNN